MTGHIVIGVDAGSGSLQEADHLVHSLAAEVSLPERAFACTHLIRAGRPHLAVSLAFQDKEAAEAAWRLLIGRSGGLATAGAHSCDTVRAGADSGPVLGLAFGRRIAGPPRLGEGAVRAASEHQDRVAGRAVRYPGAGSLTGTVTVGALLSATAVDEVVVLGSPFPPDPAQRLRTRDHVRPEWRYGRLVLSVMPAAAGLLAPFEVPDPTPCCAGHS